jgi:glutathione S-transferase
MERCSWCDAGVGWSGADETEVSLLAASEVAADGFRVCFALAFELGETGVRRITSDLRQRWVLEDRFSVVDMARHCLGWLCRQFSRLCY